VAARISQKVAVGTVLAFSLSIRDADAASTIPRRGGREGHEPSPAAAEAA
jgi:hypothetical protein